MDDHVYLPGSTFHLIGRPEQVVRRMLAGYLMHTPIAMKAAV